MVFTIVRTAAKRATFLLPTLVPTEPKTLYLKIDADARFAAGAGGVAKFFAEAAGLDGDAPQQLQAAVAAACQEAFERLPSGRPLTVGFTQHADRIEVEISYDGEAPAVGLDSIAAGASMMNGVDRIQYDTSAGRPRTRLTKYIKQGAPSR
jgi:hypothetical protein